MTRVNYRTLKKGTGCHNLIQTAACFQSTSEGQLSYQQDLPANHSTLAPACHHCNWLKKQQDIHEASPENTLPMIYSIPFTTLCIFRICRCPFFISALCTLCSMPNGHFHEPSPSDSFSYMVADEFFK